MANPNAQLQAAIAQFSSQPGVTPDKTAQLRAAITQDAQLLRLLNQDAASGQLKGFALSQAGTDPNLAGTYDKASGVVTLPATDFQPTGTAPGADLTATLRLQDMSLRFAHSTYRDAANVSQPVTQDMVTNLQSTLNGSPVLADQIRKAVTPGPGQDAPLQHFASLSGTVAGGTYDGNTRTMSLPPASLAKPPASFDSTDLTFVLGHEIQHGFNHPNKVVAYQNFDTQAKQIAQDNNPINDYTAPIGQLIQAGREDEAKAQIAGWHALLSREQQQNPAAGLKEMYDLRRQTHRVLDFVEQNPANPSQAQARPGLTFNPDATMSMTPANVATMGQNYFDKLPRGTPGIPGHQTTGIGFHGDSDYPNYYGAGAVSRAIHFDRAGLQSVNGVPTQMHINLGQLRLREDLMERNGITLTTNSNTPQPYFDISTQPPKAGLFQHTATTHQHTSPISAQPLEGPVQTADVRGPPKKFEPTNNPLIDRFFDAHQAGDREGTRAALIAFKESDRGQELMAEARELARAERERQLPRGHDHPLYAQALQHVEKLGPRVGGFNNQEELERVAGAVAMEAKLGRMPSIDAVLPSLDGKGLIATWTNPGNDVLVNRAYVDKTQAVTQPVEQNLQQLVVETQRQEQQAQLQAQQQQATQSQGMSR